MADDILMPPFPPLEWDGYAWAGEVRLPSWAGFQSRRGAYGAVSDPKKPSDGSAWLTVEAEAGEPPSAEQTAALAGLLADEPATAAAVAQALFERYPEERAAYLDDYDLESSDEVPEIADASGLRPLIGLSAVHILRVSHDGVACIGFEFGCVWEAEHGAGVMTHRGRVLAVGAADASFLAWVARRGLGAVE